MDGTLISIIVPLLLFFAIVAIVLYLSVRVVNQYERLVVFRLGKTRPELVKEPGLRFLIPVVDRPVKVDVREDFDEIPSQTNITKDNAPIDIDFLIYFRIVDPLSSVVNIYDFRAALRGIATTTLRAVIGDMNLDDVLSKRDQINDVLRARLDEQTERWGGKVTTVEIRELIPPPGVQDSMNRMLTAERTRRAVITESEGERQSKINVAEGEKQSAILRAEGERQSAILAAEGFSEALRRIFSAARDIDDRTMTLQYLEALKQLGSTAATKYVIPLELTDLARRLGNFLDNGLDTGRDVRLANAPNGKRAAPERTVRHRPIDSLRLQTRPDRAPSRRAAQLGCVEQAQGVADVDRARWLGVSDGLEITLARGRDHFAEAIGRRRVGRLQVGEQEALLVLRREGAPVGHGHDEGEAVRQGGVERLGPEVGVLGGRLVDRVHGRPAMDEALELDALHAALMDDRKELVLEVGTAAVDLVEEDRLGVPDGGRRAQVREPTVAIGYGVADEVVEAEQAGVVVTPGEAEGLRRAGQQQALAGAVRTDEQHRQLRCGSSDDDGLDVVEADKAEPFEQARHRPPRTGGWHDTFSHPAWESHRAPGVSPGPVAVPSSGPGPSGTLDGIPLRIAGARRRWLPFQDPSASPHSVGTVATPGGCAGCRAFIELCLSGALDTCRSRGP